MLSIEPVVLSTDRLTRRPLALEDAPALAVAASDGVNVMVRPALAVA